MTTHDLEVAHFPPTPQAAVESCEQMDEEVL